MIDLLRKASARAGAPSALPWQALGVLAVLPWLAIRLGWRGDSVPASFALPMDGQSWPFLHFDLGALWLLPAVALWLLAEPTRHCARTVVAALTAGHAWLYASESLTRYYRGGATAYDMALYIQPLWRAAGGKSLAFTWYGDMPLWGDHGIIASFLFVPFARAFADPGTGVLLAQALLVAGWLPALYAFARALQLERGVALLLVCSAAASRSLQSAVIYDFHFECALPLLFALALWAHQRGRFAWLVGCVALGALLKDMAALTFGMALLWLGFERRERRTLLLGALPLAIAGFDLFLLPRLSGAASYVGMHARHDTDYGLAVSTTVLRASSTMFLGWLHPLAWFAGAPWALAAGLSAKAAVKTLFFQYGFMHVPVAFAGAARMLAWLRGRARAWPAAAALWVMLTISVNAQGVLSGAQLATARQHFANQRSLLLSAAVAPRGMSVASDACIAPYLMERDVLAGLCVLDIAEFARSGKERWDAPGAHALSTQRIVVDLGCNAHGDCLAAQVARAKQLGYREGVRGPRLLVLER